MKQTYFWPMFGDQNEIVFTWSNNRGFLHAQNQLEGFTGTLLTDGYAAYRKTVATLNEKEEKILEVYAGRWGIEVDFKEAKQKLGFLKEQSRHYSAYMASIHLTGLRFCLLLFAKQEEGSARLSDVRNDFE